MMSDLVAGGIEIVVPHQFIGERETILLDLEPPFRARGGLNARGRAATDE